MKNLFKMVILFVFLLAPALLFAAQQQPAQPAPAPQGQQPQPPGMQQAPGAQQPGQPSGMPQHPMMEKCKEMMAKSQKAMEQIDQMDAALDKKIAAMNQATGDAKVQAMAEVITLMAQQREQTRDIMADVHHGEMMHMMEHMGPAGKHAMDCPMMRQHGGGMHPGMPGPGTGSGAAPQAGPQTGMGAKPGAAAQ